MKIGEISFLTRGNAASIVLLELSVGSLLGDLLLLLTILNETCVNACKTSQDTRSVVSSTTIANRWRGGPLAIFALTDEHC